MRISHVLAAGLVLGAVTGPLAAQERKTIPGPDVAIYNLAGIMKLEAGSGADVAVEIARGGRDGGKLTVATGEIRGRQTLRVIYPEDDIYYSANGFNSGETTLEALHLQCFTVLFYCGVLQSLATGRNDQSGKGTLLACFDVIYSPKE